MSINESRAGADNRGCADRWVDSGFAPICDQRSCVHRQRWQLLTCLASRSMAGRYAALRTPPGYRLIPLSRMYQAHRGTSATMKTEKAAPKLNEELPDAWERF